MADWTQDPTNPALVMSPDGRVAPRDALGPMDRVVAGPPAMAAPALPTTPAAAMPNAAPAIPGAPQPPLNATGVLAKLDAVTGPLNGRKYTEQVSTTTQSPISQKVLAPVMARGTERAATQAEAVTTRGENAAQRGEQQAMNQATSAYGGYQQAEADRQQAAQRAEVARQSQIATMAQEDPAIDPGRYVRNMSTGQSVGTVILAALQGAFRGMGGQMATGEGVTDILQRRIDQDIQAQKEQIASGRIRKGNLISYFANQGMNEEAAEKAAKAMSWAQLERLTQAENARIGAGAPRDEAAVMAEAIKAQREQANDELLLTLGTPRSSTTTVKTEAQGATGGSEAFSKLFANRKAYEESGATPEQLAAFDKAKGMADMAPGGESETARGKREAGEESARKASAQSADEGKAADARKAIEAHATANGLVRQGGKWVVGEGWIPPAFGEGIKGFFGGSTPGRDSADAAVEAYGRFRSGGVIGPSERADFQDQLGLNTTTRAQLASKLNAAEGTIENQLSDKQRGATGDRANPEAAGFRKVK